MKMVYLNWYKVMMKLFMDVRRNPRFKIFTFFNTIFPIICTLIIYRQES